MPRFLMTIRFDGTAYHGWQVQNNAVTIQQTVQDSLEAVLKFRPNVSGCSRTDSGVHAEKYCFHFDFDGKIPPDKLVLALNTKLPDDISALDCIKVADDFHARYSVHSKQYTYRIYTGNIRNPFLRKYSYHPKFTLDVDKMNIAAKQFCGTHDFTSFCTIDKREKGDFTRNVKMFSVERQDKLVTMTVEADGFLYNMVRIMVGTLLRIQQGKIAPDEIPFIIQQENRRFAGPTAPAQGLYLNKVNY